MDGWEFEGEFDVLAGAGLAVVTPDSVWFEADVDDSAVGCFGGQGSVEDHSTNLSIKRIVRLKAGADLRPNQTVLKLIAKLLRAFSIRTIICKTLLLVVCFFTSSSNLLSFQLQKC